MFEEKKTRPERKYSVTFLMKVGTKTGILKRSIQKNLL